jgi:hypothetical protein
MKNSTAYANVDEFFNELRAHIIKSKDTKDKIIEKINSLDEAEIEHIDDDYIIAWIYSVNASRKLGSSNWCISYTNTDMHMYSYVIDHMNKQYFIWDFTEDPNSNYYKVGITLNTNTNKIEHCHLVDDKNCIENVKNFGWYKYIKPLTDKQFEKFYQYLVNNNIEIKSINKVLRFSIINNDFNGFKNIIDKKYDDIEKTKIIEFSKLIIKYNRIEFLKHIAHIFNGVLIGMKSLLEYAKELNNTEIVNYINSMYNPEIDKAFARAKKLIPGFE